MDTLLPSCPTFSGVDPEEKSEGGGGEYNFQGLYSTFLYCWSHFIEHAGADRGGGGGGGGGG